MSEIEERLAQVRARIAEAERRSPYGQEVTLVAVTKFHPLEDMEEAIRIIDGRAETECSGNVTKENIARLVKLGVDYISSGALTHSAPILDISLKNLHEIAN